MCTNEARNSYIYKPIIHLFTMIASVTINVTIAVMYIYIIVIYIYECKCVCIEVVTSNRVINF